jgi:hypothetical protein
MGKFNPEDFKVPAMEPLSTITVNGESVEWDLVKDGLVVPHAKGWIRLMDEQTKALYEETGGFWFELKIKDGNIESNVESVRGKKTDIDPELFKEPIKEPLKQGNFYRECSCKSCGAPIGFYSVDAKTYAEAKCKGRKTNNFTEDELERHYGISFENIDGVIYDDSRECNSCRSYC